MRFEPSDQPGVAVAELMAPCAVDFDGINAAAISRIPENGWQDRFPANWKSLREVDNEGCHVRQAHPALHDLYGDGYVDGLWQGLTSRSDGVFNERPRRFWSVRAYKRVVGATPLTGDQASE